MLLDDVRNRRTGYEGNGEKDNHEHRFSQKTYHAGSTSAHRTVWIAGVDRSQRGEEAA